VNKVECAVETAIIPCAGLGVRMRPVSKFIPKELLPICGRPMIQLCVEEAIRAGVKRICVIVSQRKRAIVDFLRSQEPIEYAVRLRRSEAKEAYKESLTFVHQDDPQGIADAISRAEETASGGAFAILLPDMVHWCDEPVISQVARQWEGYGARGSRALPSACRGDRHVLAMRTYREKASFRAHLRHNWIGKQERRFSECRGDCDVPSSNL